MQVVLLASWQLTPTYGSLDLVEDVCASVCVLVCQILSELQTENIRIGKTMTVTNNQIKQELLLITRVKKKLITSP